MKDIISLIKKNNRFKKLLRLNRKIERMFLNHRTIDELSFFVLSFDKISGNFYSGKIIDKFSKFLLRFFLNNDLNLNDNKINLFGKNFYYSKKNNPYKHYSLYQLIILIHDIIIKDQYHLDDFVKKDWTIIDAGGHIGVFSFFASKISKSNKIFAFEPAKENFELFRKNIKENSIKNIFLFNYGLGEKSKELELLVSPGRNTANSLKETGLMKDKNSKTEKIKIISIDKFVEEKRLKRIDFIKIDTEGYEKQILIGAKNTIKKFKPKLAIAAYHYKNDKKEIPEIVKSINNNYYYKLSKRAEEDLIFY